MYDDMNRHSWEKRSSKIEKDNNSLDDLYSRITQKHLPSEVLPNGHTRQDFHDAGYSDKDIEFWGLDKPGAPDPISAGYIIADLFDGNFDGNFSWPFNI